MTRRPKCLGAVRFLLGAVCLTLLTGCAPQEVPIVSKETRVTNETLEEQQAWMRKQLDATVAASGVSDGWYDIFDHSAFWLESASELKSRLMAATLPRDCGTGASGRIEFMLKNTTAEDPLAAAAKVREFWERSGWTVTNVRSYATEGSNPYFRADREDGAQMGFQASAEGMSLDVTSACSVNATVTHWQDSVDGANAFRDELASREQTEA